MSFFGVNVNPFSTPVGQKIEQATDSSLPSENWALNMEICDIINETEDGPRDAIKAIKRRLNQAAGKNYTIFMYTLTVLETCVKNCGKRFHAQACSREFVQELVKLIGPKNEPPTAVQEKVLSLIQTWADTFRHQPHTQGVVQIYQELKVKGIQFPMTDLDAMAPIITPERSVPETEQNAISVPTSDLQTIITASAQTQQPQQQQQHQYHHQQQQPQQPQQQQPQQHHHHQQQQQQQQQLQNQISGNQLTQLNEQQMAKLQSELDVVQGNMRVLSEMLAYLTSPDQSVNQQPDSADLELLTELHATCKAMQERVVDLIGKLAHDEMTAELLRINDELNNLFLRYSRYTKNKTIVPASAILAQAIGHPPIHHSADSSLQPHSKREAIDSLIDLSDENDSLAKQVATMGVVDDGDVPRPQRKSKDGDGDEFDMFAQSRNATYESAKNSGSKYEDNLEQVSGGGLSTAILNRNSPKHPQQIASAVASAATTSLNRESEFSEMAAWLDRTPGAHGDQESLTSSEFERFLAERAAAADALPNLTTTTATAVSTVPTSVPPLTSSPPSQSLPQQLSSPSSSTPPPQQLSTTSLSTSLSNGANSGNTNAQRQTEKDQEKSLFAL